jgi:CBS domain-containing protein
VIPVSSFAVTSIARHPPAVLLKTGSTVAESIHQLAEKSVRHAIVSNDGRKLDGIISAKDLLNFLGGGNKFRVEGLDPSEGLQKVLLSSIATIVNPKPIVGSTIATLPDTMAVMAKHDIGMIPLLEPDGTIWGSLSERHLFRLFEAKQMFVRVFEIMSKPVISLDIKSTLLDAMKTMIKNDIRRILVMRDGDLWGIVTVKDIVRFLDSQYVHDTIKMGLCDYLLNVNISKLATANPKTCDPDEDLCDAVKKMNSFNVGSLVVMSGGRPVGILTERDFLLKLPRLRGVEFITDVNKNRVLVGRIHF